MQYRQLGRSGLRLSALTLGTMTFGGKGDFAKTGNTDTAGARRLIDLCLDAGITMFDTADIYSSGESETILGEALKGARRKFWSRPKPAFARRTDQTGLGPPACISLPRVRPA